MQIMKLASKVKTWFKTRKKKEKKLSGLKRIIIATMICVTMLSITAMGLLLYRNASDSIYDNVGNYSISLLMQSKTTIEDELKNIEKYCLDIEKLPEVENGLKTYMSLPEQLPASELQTAVDSSAQQVQTTTKKDVMDAIASAVSTYMSGSVFNNLSCEIAPYDQSGLVGAKVVRRSEERRNRVKEIAEKNGERGIWYLEDNINITYAKVLKNPDTGEKTFCLIMSMTPSRLASLFKDVNCGEGAELAVLNGEGLVMASNNSKLAITSKYNSSFVDKLFQSIGNSDNKLMQPEVMPMPATSPGPQSVGNSGNKHMDYFKYMVDGKPYLGFYTRIGGTDWFFTGTVPGKVVDGGVQTVRWYLILTSIICIPLVLIIGILITRSISLPLSKLAVIMQSLKQGDLTVNVEDKGRDEVGDVIKNINEMVKGVNSLIEGSRQIAADVVKTAQNVKTVTDNNMINSEQIAEVIQGLAGGASSQARDVSEFAITIDKLSAKIKDVSKSMQNVISLIDQSKQVNLKACAQMGKLQEQSINTRNEVDRVVRDITDMSREIEKLKEVIRVILGVVDKTNLIALNSAIEAAKAKENGKGFTVIANQVKRLADESLSSLHIMSDNIKDVLEKTTCLVDCANETRNIIGEQLKTVESTSDVFNEMTLSLEKVVQHAGEVNEKTLRILEKSQDTLNAVKGVSLIAEETVAISEEVSAATEEQKNSADKLYKTVEKLDSLARKLEEAILVFKTV